MLTGRVPTFDNPHLNSISTVEPRFNEVQRDWGNWFVISRFFSIHYTITGLKNIVRYTEDFVT